MRGECGARPAMLDGSAWPVCEVLTVNHRDRDHRWSGEGGYEWPACSQFCMIDHVHGAYRLHLGQALGPKSAASRAPKPDRPQARKSRQCRTCLAEAELAGGTCKDRAACQARLAPLFAIGETPCG